MQNHKMYYVVVIVSVFTASLSQMFLKKGASKRYSSFIREYLNLWVIGGYALMGLSLVVNVFAMSKGIQIKEISIIESLSYLFVPILSFLCFKEELSKKKILSSSLILLGIFVFFI